MAITYKYEKPQVKVYQNFTEVNTATVGTQPAFVFGPAYQLYRYNNEDEHDLSQLVDGDGVGITYNGAEAITAEYPDNIPNVDTSWDRMAVFFEDAYAQLWNIDAVLLDTDSVVLPNGYTKEKFATYVGFKRVDREVGPRVRPGDFLANEAYQVEAVYANPKYNKTATGDVLKESAYIAKVDAVFDPSVLDGTAFKSIEVWQHYDSVNVPKEIYTEDNDNWEPNDASITIRAGVNVATTRKEQPAQVVKAARIYVQFRFLDTTTASSIDHIIDVSEITGQIDPGNPLWYGVYLAKLNSGECPVYYMSTQGVELSRYIEVLKKATLTDDIYALCPMTDDKEIIDAVEGHVNEMSGPETKRWRIAFIAPPVDEENTITDIDGKVMYLKVKNATAKTMLFVKSALDDTPDDKVSAKKMFAPNDEITITYQGASGTDQTDIIQIDRIINDQLIQVRSLPAGITADSVPDKVEKIVHRYTSSELADIVASTARHYADRRMYAVFPTEITQLVDGETMVVKGYFAAAACAGLCSSTLPQQPLTNMPINGIYDVPATYSRFDAIELNTMAAGGAFIVAQDLPYDVVYVRHQLSTATYQGNLLTRELSITKNVDSISYYLAESCDDFIGKYNITPELIRHVRVRLEASLTELKRDKGSLYGPQLLGENTEIISVDVHPTLADHIEAYIRINPPKPFNVLEIRLTVV